MSDWYDNYIAGVNKAAENVKPVKEVSQQVLHLKAIGSKALSDTEDRYTFGGDGDGDSPFGFTETLVNQLMQFAFDQGRKDIDEKSFNAGHYQCWQEVLNKLDITECDENCGES